MCARGLGCCLHLRGDMLCSALPRGLGAPLLCGGGGGGRGGGRGGCGPGRCELI